jgi:hypothetical protein
MQSLGFRKQVLINNFEKIFGQKGEWSKQINILFAYEWGMEQLNRNKV